MRPARGCRAWPRWSFAPRTSDNALQESRTSPVRRDGSPATRPTTCCPGRNKWRGWSSSNGGDGGKTALQVGPQIFDILQSHRDPQQALCDSSALALRSGDARMRGAGWVSNGGFHIAEIGGDRHQLRRIDEGPRAFTTARHVEGQYPAESRLLAKIGRAHV